MLSIEAQTAILKMKNSRDANFQYALTESLNNQRSEWENSAKEYQLPEELEYSDMRIAGITGALIAHKRFSKESPIKGKLILHFHGGGLNQGSAITHKKLGGLIVSETNIPLFIHNYSLAPENPFPKALLDSVEVYEELLKLGYLAENIIFGSDSSGAALMCSTIISLRDKHHKLPKAMYLLSPQLDNTFTGQSMETNKMNDHRVSLEDLTNCANDYRGAESIHNPLISPIYADLRLFPPTFIQAGSAELLLDDAVRFEQRLSEAGVEASLDVWEEMWHVFQSSADKVPESKKALENLQHFLREYM